MQRLLGEVEKENRRFSEQFVEVEQQNTNLANLYVASYRLHATLDRTEVLEGIQEIVANLIGCEELAILEVTEDGRSLSLLASYGIDPAAFRSVPLGAGIVGHTALTGETYLAQGTDERVPQEADLSACLPLKLGGRVTGVLALFRLLPQKRGFEAVDYELFDLLATHAATALYCTGLHARLAAETLGQR